MKFRIILLCLGLIFFKPQLFSQYKGTASVSQGLATDIVVSNLYNCTGGRTAGLANIQSSDGKNWKIPADVNFNNANFPSASDLHNSCIGLNYTTSTQALSKLNGNDIVVIDTLGEIVTGFVFADNYFEMYINGIPVGKDKVPFTQFNSSIVRFKVKRPFTIAMKLVDWEEKLGVGCENNNGFAYHSGDGGMVAVFTDENKNIIATTNQNWKAQTFYVSPIKDLTCPTESGKQRLSVNCNISDANDGTKYYALHWEIPTGWQNVDFVDSVWPNAAEYTNSEIGVDNKPAYMNFTDIFDNQNNDAQFIWTSNVILDNVVLTRFTVPSLTNQKKESSLLKNWTPKPNPVCDQLDLNLGELKLYYPQITLYDCNLLKIKEVDCNSDYLSFEKYSSGVYFVKLQGSNFSETKKIIKY